MRLIDADALISEIKNDTEKAIEQDDIVGSFWLGYIAGLVIKQPTAQPSTSDMISRQAVINAIENTDAKMSMPEWDEITNTVMSLPTIQPEPHEGHWIQYDKRFPWRSHYKCSECGNYLDFSGVNGGRGKANYCPNCGARMKGKIT